MYTLCATHIAWMTGLNLLVVMFTEKHIKLFFNNRNDALKNVNLRVGKLIR
jgi:hypothetical protein